MTDDVAIIGARVVDTEPAWIVEGSEQRACMECGAQVWISPASLRLGPVRIRCIQCWQLSGASDVSPATPAQVAEILSVLRKRELG